MQQVCCYPELDKTEHFFGFVQWDHFNGSRCAVRDCVVRGWPEQRWPKFSKLPSFTETEIFFLMSQFKLGLPYYSGGNSFILNILTNFRSRGMKRGTQRLPRISLRRPPTRLFIGMREGERVFATDGEDGRERRTSIVRMRGSSLRGGLLRRGVCR